MRLRQSSWHLWRGCRSPKTRWSRSQGTSSSLSHRVLRERGEQLCSGHARLGTLKQDLPMLRDMPPQGTNAVPSSRIGGADLGSATSSNERDGDRALARHELRRILRDRRAPHAARVSAACPRRDGVPGAVGRVRPSIQGAARVPGDRPPRAPPRAVTGAPHEGWVAACPLRRRRC